MRQRPTDIAQLGPPGRGHRPPRSRRPPRRGSRQALVALKEKDHRERAAPHGERRPVRSTAQDPLAGILHRLSRGPSLSIEKPKIFELADQDRQRDAVHVAVADRLGQKLGDEAKAHHAGQDAHRAGDDRHHAGQRDCTVRIAAGQGKDDAEDDGGQRRVRPRTRMRLGRTAHRPAAGRSCRGCRSRARPTPPHRRCPPGPASWSGRGPPRRRAAARLGRSGAAAPAPAASARIERAPTPVSLPARPVPSASDLSSGSVLRAARKPPSTPWAALRSSIFGRSTDSLR